MAANLNKTSKVVTRGDKSPVEVLKSLYRGESGNTKTSRLTKIPLLNTYQKLSRSHDNLTGSPRKQSIPLTMAIGKKTAGKDHSPSIRGNVKALMIPAMKKSYSTQNFDKGSNIAEISSRAQSVQNICRIPLPIGARSSKALLAQKRSSSAQNMINNGQRTARQPQSTAAAYNAELLSNFEKEKKSQERRISELIQVSENRKAEMEKLKFEIRKKTEDMNEAVNSLRSENKKLREQLHEHGIATSHFTDNDKILLLEQVGGENRSSAELSHDETLGSFRTASDGGEESMNLHRSSVGTSVGNLSSLTTQNVSFQSADFSSLDRQNSMSVESGLSGLGLAYLRDRILQMQETNYSTNEELQATLQELTDLQDTVNELSTENEKLCDEKSILLESLCTQTEKLENARLQIEHLKALLIQDSNNNDRSENECQLVALIRSAQEEREELLLKQAEFNNALAAFQNENRELQDIVSALRDRAELEESKSKVFLNDKRTLESLLSDMKNQNITDQLEIAKYKTLLESERQKSAKSEPLDCIPESQNNCEETITMTRKTEEQTAYTEQTVIELKNELLKTKELNSCLNESVRTVQIDAQTKLKKLEVQIEELELEKLKLLQKIELLEDSLCASQLNHKLVAEENVHHLTEIRRIETELVSSRKEICDLKVSLDEQKKQSKEMEDEWLQLQKDLQVAVVIANDLKTETEYAMENVSTENQILKEKLATITKDLNLLRNEREILKQRELELSSSPATFAANRLAALRHGRLGSDSSKPTELLMKKILAEEREKSERGLVQLLSPSPNDTCSRQQDASSPDNHKMTTAISADAVATDNSASNQRLTKTDSVATGVSLNAVSEVRSSASDADGVSVETLSAVGDSPKKTLHGILSNKNQPRKGVFSGEGYDKTVSEKMTTGLSPLQIVKSDPLASLAKQLGGSKRNALLKWCQNKTASYPGIDITNFSSSWNDGLALCALLHSYLPDKIPFKDLSSQDKMRNFKCAFDTAESIGIITGPDTNVLIVTERPDWQAVFSYVTSIYKHFEVDSKC